jgi:predicted nuclease of predicted toxin-antitoxin system
MIIWIDAQLSPALAAWITEQFGVPAVALRDIGLRDEEDREIFAAARQAAAIVMSKDSDFVNLLAAHGAPPQIIWVTCGNTSNANLRQILGQTLPTALQLLQDGEQLVEIGCLERAPQGGDVVRKPSE